MIGRAYPYYLESWRQPLRFLEEQLQPMLLVVDIYGFCSWIFMNSFYVRLQGEITNTLLVSEPTALLALAMPMSWIEYETQMLR
jgi:hypothetical protein